MYNTLTARDQRQCRFKTVTHMEAGLVVVVCGVVNTHSVVFSIPTHVLPVSVLHDVLVSCLHFADVCILILFWGRKRSVTELNDFS